MKREKNILFLSRPLTNSFDEGSKNLVYNLCLLLRKNATVLVDKSFDSYLPPTVAPIRLPFAIDTQFVESSRSLKVKMYNLTLLLRLFRYNPIHAFFSLTQLNCIPLLVAHYLFQKKIFVNLPSGQNKYIGKPLVKLLLRRAAVVCVMTEHTAYQLALSGIVAEVVPPLIDPNRFFPIDLEKKESLRRKLNLSEYFVVIYPGEYSRLDGNENIIRIVRGVSTKCQKVLFVMACRLKSRKDKEVEAFIKNSVSAHCNVLFLNESQSYFEYAAASDMAIFPINSMRGKFDLPLSLVELMVMGKPVLHSDIAPLNELYEGSSYLCLPPKSECFVRALIEIAENAELYTELVKQTFHEASRFAPKKIVERFRSIYAKNC